MAPFALIALGVLGWAWFTGRLAGWTGLDAIALAAILLGAKLIAGGAALPGLVFAVGGAIWIGRNWSRLRAATQAGPPRRAGERELADARALLNLTPWANEPEIRAAYRARIKAAHPDSGGNAFDANRLASARDLLLADLAARKLR